MDSYLQRDSPDNTEDGTNKLSTVKLSIVFVSQSQMLLKKKEWLSVLILSWYEFI